jgi:hypothetical protein
MPGPPPARFPSIVLQQHRALIVLVVHLRFSHAPLGFQEAPGSPQCHWHWVVNSHRFCLVDVEHADPFPIGIVTPV